MSERAKIVRSASKTIALGSKSFAAASRLFDRATRERVWMLYAWCRACDDLADGQTMGHDMARVDDPQITLATIRARTDAALAGEATGDPAFDALRIVAAECRLPHTLVHDVIDGFALDAADWRPRSERDLLQYCYHVAGAVGCLMAIVMGVPPMDEATLDRACDLGLAFQLANIARDIEEDDRNGRCYLPEEWLVEMDIPPGQHMKPPFRSRLTVLARRLASMAEGYEASARIGTKHLSFRSAWAVSAAAGIYGDIGRKVAKAGDNAWDHRIHTSIWEKIDHIVDSAAQALSRHQLPDTPRDETLWKRPVR